MAQNYNIKKYIQIPHLIQKRNNNDYDNLFKVLRILQFVVHERINATKYKTGVKWDDLF